MSIGEEQIYSALTGDASIVALVAKRIYPLVLAQSDLLPSIVYSRVSTVPYNTMCGDTMVSRPRIQIDIYAQTFTGATGIATMVSLVRNALKTLCTFQGQLNFSETERGIYRSTLDFMIHEEL